MKITYTLTADDCIAARWAVLKPRPCFQPLGWLVAFAYLGSLGMSIHRHFSNQESATSLLILLGAGAYIGVIFLLVMPRKVRKVFAEQKSLREPVELELTDEKLLGACPSGTFNIAWKDVLQWKHTKSVVLIYESSAIMRLIPLRALNEAERVQLLTLLETHLGPPKA